MRLICGIAAITLLIAGLVVIRQTIKTGKIFDCLEGSNTERQWIDQTEHPVKFRSIIVIYSIIFSIAMLALGWLAIDGKPSA